MNLFRIHIRPKGGTANMEDTFKYCLKNKLLGVGWRINGATSITNWDEYFAKAQKDYTSVNVCKYIRNNICKDDLVWTRDPKPNYYLARVDSGWEYCVYKEAAVKDIDVANIFRVEFQEVPIDQVPGKVIASFRAPRTIQSVHDESACEYSKYLWNKLRGMPYYHDIGSFDDIFMLLDSEETEDLVFMYLQRLGWLLVPNSRKGDTMGFEYLAVNPKTGEIAVTQVKTGNTPLDPSKYSSEQWAAADKIFLFQSNGKYGDSDQGNKDRIVCLEPEKLKNFLKKSLEWLPAVFKTKLEMLAG